MTLLLAVCRGSSTATAALRSRRVARLRALLVRSAATSPACASGSSATGGSAARSPRAPQPSRWTSATTHGTTPASRLRRGPRRAARGLRRGQPARPAHRRATEPPPRCRRRLALLPRGRPSSSTRRAGPVLDEAALVDALVVGPPRRGGARRLRRRAQRQPSGCSTRPNVVLTPHIGSATRETRAGDVRRWPSTRSSRCSRAAPTATSSQRWSSRGED